MNQMEIFKNPEFGSIRTFEQDGKVLFCGTDVATALGYANPRKAVRDHTRCGTKCSIGVQTGKKADGSPAVQMVEMLFIPEGDVYRLIVHSKLPSAERFERWVFDEVLPSIRQHGAYLTREKLWEVATSPEALLKLCSDLLAEREKNAALQADNARLQGKAVYYDRVTNMTSACGVVEQFASGNETEEPVFVYGDLKARGDIFEEFYYNMEKSSIAKHKPEQKTYTVGDEIPTKSETYEYPEYFDILILRDQAAVQVRDNKIEAILPLADYRYSGVPVVNGRGFAVNVKSQKDLQAFLYR